MNPVLDYNGRPLIPGAPVAYNYSGDVRFGNIKQIKRARDYRARNNPVQYGHQFVVEEPDGSQSTVRNNRSLAVVP